MCYQFFGSLIWPVGHGDTTHRTVASLGYLLNALEKPLSVESVNLPDW